MKYLIPTALLLALCGCETNNKGPQDGDGVVASTENAAAGKTPSYLDKPLKGKVSQHGLYKLVRSGGLIDDPKTGTGKAISKPVIQKVRSTQLIPLFKGAQMYLQFRIWSLPDQPAYVDLRRVLKHPEMTLPDGSVSMGSDYTIKGKVSVNQVIAYTGYGLDEDYELVEGDWVFEIWYQDRKVIEQTFTTYQPDEEEIAALATLLSPGRKVDGNEQSSGYPFSRSDWPVMTVGETNPPGKPDQKKE